MRTLQIKCEYQKIENFWQPWQLKCVFSVVKQYVEYFYEHITNKTCAFIDKIHTLKISALVVAAVDFGRSCFFNF
jgi:hypothetical protein